MVTVAVGWNGDSDLQGSCREVASNSLCPLQNYVGGPIKGELFWENSLCSEAEILPLYQTISISL